MPKKYKVKTFTIWRTDPSATAAEKRDLFVNMRLFGTGRIDDSDLEDVWIEVTLVPDDENKGWVREADVDDVSDEPRPDDFSRPAFVKLMIEGERTFNRRKDTPPWFALADFVIARAILETGLTNAGEKIPGSGGLGPLQVTPGEWDNLTAEAPDFSEGLTPAHRDHPIAQQPAAIYRIHRDAKKISDLVPQPDLDGKKNPFLPSYLDVFNAYIADSPEAAVALLTAEKAGENTRSIEDVLGILPAAQAEALLTNRADYFGSPGSSKKLEDFLSETRKRLNEALAQAFELIKQHAPEDLPIVSAGGSAPWFEVAKREAAKGIDENVPQHKTTIVNYFKSTDTVTNEVLNWCGAFAAFCMKDSGDPAVAASVPKGAAIAANWKNWGVALPPGQQEYPAGAVVVLSPAPGTETSGHVGFFVEFVGDKIKLLGGNQGDKVQPTDFPVSRIVDVRWIDVMPAAEGAPFNTAALPNRPEALEMAQLIVKRFAEAGFGRFQQISALANAIGESNLNPHAESPGAENSVGLFQINRGAALGKDYTEAQLKDPELNIRIIIAEARKYSSFTTATTIRGAVEAFVRKVERPKDQEGAIVKRTATAEQLLA